jgi:NAD/NADP transhydrogenase alpha subunit
MAAHEAAGVAMLVGVPREIKDNEYRVGIVPSTVRELADKGHQVVIETHAGAGAGFLDADYQSARAEIVPNGITLGRSKFVCPARARQPPRKFPVRFRSMLRTCEIWSPLVR